MNVCNMNVYMNVFMYTCMYVVRMYVISIYVCVLFITCFLYNKPSDLINGRRDLVHHIINTFTIAKSINKISYV